MYELGSPEAINMCETMMERIARVTGKDPIEVRMINMAPDEKNIAEPMWNDLKKTSDYDKRLKDVNKFNNVIITIATVITKNLSITINRLFSGKSLEKARNFCCIHEVSFGNLGTISCSGFNLCPRWHSLHLSWWHRNGSRLEHKSNLLKFIYILQ